MRRRAGVQGPGSTAASPSSYAVDPAGPADLRRLHSPALEAQQADLLVAGEAAAAVRLEGLLGLLGPIGLGAGDLGGRGLRLRRRGDLDGEGGCGGRRGRLGNSGGGADRRRGRLGLVTRLALGLRLPEALAAEAVGRGVACGRVRRRGGSSGGGRLPGRGQLRLAKALPRCRACPPLPARALTEEAAVPLAQRGLRLAVGVDAVLHCCPVGGALGDESRGGLALERQPPGETAEGGDSRRLWEQKAVPETGRR